MVVERSEESAYWPVYALMCTPYILFLVAAVGTGCDRVRK